MSPPRRQRVRTYLVAGVLAAIVAASTTAGAATSSVNVTLSVASTSTMDASGCTQGGAGTSFGAVLPSASYVATADCTVSFGSNNDTAMLRLYQQDGRGVAAWRSPHGPLDTTLNLTGRVATPILAGNDSGHDVAVDASGRLVAVGSAHNGTNDDVAVVRYTPTGAPDPSFDPVGLDGIVVRDVSGIDTAFTVAVQPDGRIVVGGVSNNDFLLMRFLPTGALDTSFDPVGLDGIVTTNISGTDRIRDLVLLADGRILAVGSSALGVTLARYRADGSLDPTFDPVGLDGIVTSSAASYAYGVALHTDGSIALAVTCETGLPACGAYYANIGSMRLTSNGGIMGSYSGDGVAVADTGAGSFAEGDVVIDPDGKVVVAGWDDLGQFSLSRWTAAGLPDPTFDGDGVLRLPTGGGYGLVRMPDGNYVAAGWSGSNAHVVRVRASDGQLDPTFDTDGRLDIPAPSSSASLYSLALDSDGRLVAVGTTGAWGVRDFFVARLAATTLADYAPGTSDWSNGAGGFGACLRATSGSGVSATWPVDGNGTCTAQNSDPWAGIPATSAAVGAKVATSTAGSTTATAHLRFGVRVPATQSPGAYVAPVAFEVVAPAS